MRTGASILDIARLPRATFYGWALIVLTCSGLLAEAIWAQTGGRFDLLLAALLLAGIIMLGWLTAGRLADLDWHPALTLLVLAPGGLLLLLAAAAAPGSPQVNRYGQWPPPAGPAEHTTPTGTRRWRTAHRLLFGNPFRADR